MAEDLHTDGLTRDQACRILNHQFPGHGGTITEELDELYGES